jgi:hypothetical protein
MKNMTGVREELTARVAALNRDELRRKFLDQDEFLMLENFLPASILEKVLADLPTLAPHIHRNYVPVIKKGGSISRFVIDRLSPVVGEIYNTPAFLDLLRYLTSDELQACPERDPHTYALYYYTEPGDHIGFHYDTSYYRGKRYTLLLGLVDRSSCKLACDLYKGNPNREERRISVSLNPGALVFFNGDRLYHAVTPLGEGEERIVLTMEYVTDQYMNPFARLFSNLKDAFSYFGLRHVFLEGKPRPTRPSPR